jgi:T-complex protein 1 subunit alpha
MVVNVAELGDEHLINAAKTSMSSKIIGKESDFFSKLAVDAVKSVKMNATAADVAGYDAMGASSRDAETPAATATKSGKQRYKYPLSAIHILKAHGKSSMDSHLIDGGFAINAMRAAQGMPTFVESAEEGNPVKIAMLDMNLQRHRMGMGVQVIVKDPAEIERIKKREMDITRERIRKIIDAGAKVVLTTKGVDDLCMKYFVEAGIICARRCNREDLKRLAKATGGRVVTTMADMEGNETFDPESLGGCDSVREVRIGDGEMLYVYGCKGHGASTIVLRGANEYMLDEMDRALHDSLCVVKRMLESSTLVPGGGAAEAALSVYLDDYANTIKSREQMVIQEYADALLVIPKTLSVNAAKDASELVAKLRSIHAKGQHSEDDADDALKFMGLNLVDGTIRDNLLAGVVEPAISKIKSLRFATEAAITILRIDDRITLNDDKGLQ